jgi:phosphatidate cytidylyltransferase
VISAIIVLGILVLAIATLDHFDRLFFATGPLTVGLIAVVTIPFDNPKGYIQRVALGTFGGT